MGQQIDLTTQQARAALGVDFPTVSVGFTPDSPAIFAGEDALFGPQDGASVEARLLNGNDQAILYSGFNFLNGNAGADSFFLVGGEGRVLGGSDDDFIQIEGGSYGKVNGNNGNDYLINFASSFGQVRGGAGNDILANAGGGEAVFYGDRGADTFVPYAVDDLGNVLETAMIIKDFQPGVDVLDTSNLGGALLDYSDAGTWIIAQSTGQIVGLVENVFI